MRSVARALCSNASSRQAITPTLSRFKVREREQRGEPSCPLYRAPKREREGPKAKTWGGEGIASRCRSVKAAA
jgi:hypothetical protein